MTRLPDSLKSEILVVGAGVLGLCVAVELTRRGHEVQVIDAGAPNASAVAAGMIAPAVEAVLDDVTPERAALFRDARTAWDGFAAAAGIALNAVATLWAGGEAQAIADRLVSLGFKPPEPGADGTLSLASDALVEPAPAMAAMQAALRHAVIVGQVDRIDRTAKGWRVTTGDRAVEADTLVLATGAAAAIDGLPGAVAGLVGQITPVRGQIGWAEALRPQAVVRGRGIYVAPSGAGAVIGATMEPGRRDLEPDMAAGERLRASAERLLGHPIEGDIEWRVGIRGATPDGLPMAGASGAAGLFLALAPRRNGWLLGPLVGRIVAEAIEGGGAGSPHAAALDPARFLSR